LSNKCITFFTDNLGVVHIINKQSSKDPTIMKLVRKFDVLTLQFNILFKAKPMFSKQTPKCKMKFQNMKLMMLGTV
jgi:hypothetical protein